MSSKTEFTAKEMQVLATAWQCMDTQPKIDMPKLARLNGYTNDRSAGNCWSQIKKKLLNMATESISGSTDDTPTAKKASAPSKPATANRKGGAGSKRKKATGVENDEIIVKKDPDATESDDYPSSIDMETVEKGRRKRAKVPHTPRFPGLANAGAVKKARVDAAKSAVPAVGSEEKCKRTVYVAVPQPSSAAKRGQRSRSVTAEANGHGKGVAKGKKVELADDEDVFGEVMDQIIEEV